VTTPAPARILLLLCPLLLLLAGCRAHRSGASAPPPQPAAEPLPLVLETFDEAWRILHEGHFDTNFNGHNWLEVRGQFRPRARAARSDAELRGVIQQMLDLLEVSHLAIVGGEVADWENEDVGAEASLEEAGDEDRGALGFDVRYLGSDLLVTRVEPGLPAESAGVRPGWILRSIRGQPAARFKTALPSSLEERRRNFLAWRAASNRLAGAPGARIALEFEDGGGRLRPLELTRQAAPGEAVQFASLPVLYAHLASSELSAGPARVGLIRFNIWMLPTALAFHRAIDEHRAKDGIIIDLRGNVGGMVGMIIGTAGHFVTNSITLGAIIARDNTLTLPANPRWADASGKRARPYGGPVAILVDEITASASEVFAGGLQEHGRARVFGRTTSGQALPAVYSKLPNGDALYHPVADLLTPEGTRFEGRGVAPDEAVPLDRPALLAGRDPALEKALQWIGAQQHSR